jgi:DNA-binding IclR family transcriptional regulator
VLDYLKNNEPISTAELAKKLNVPSKEKRTFYRAVKDLKCLDLVEGEDVLRLHGTNVEEARFTVGPRVIRVTVPLKKELARQVLNKRPFIKRAITVRKGVAYDLLTALGFLKVDEEK